MEEIFYDIFSDLPRQGPGNKRSTKLAIDRINSIPDNPKILDIGCGTGIQTCQLAHILGGEITALDSYEPYLRELKKQADKFGYGENIKVVCGDMNQLEFPTKSFDIIWAEGSIYIIGFQEGLSYFKSFLKDSGYIAVTEISWLKNNQPQELLDFWKLEYPSMTTVKENLNRIQEMGYTLVDYFFLSPVAWWDDYYTPLEKRLVELQRKYLENDQALELIEFVQLEIDLYRKYHEFYGYVFYIMQNS